MHDLTSVHPELRPFVAALQERLGPPGFEGGKLAARRKMALTPPPAETPHWIERIIPGLRSEPDVRVYVINADRSVPKPVVLHMHGGGFVMRDAYSAIHHMQELAHELDCVVITVDYRLAPETRFPGALNDNYAALAWLHENADEIGVDRKRVALLGDSAGGAHAAMLAIAARDRGEYPIALQALIYPMLDDRTGVSRPIPAHQGGLIWTVEEGRFGWSALLGVPAGADKIPYGASPARVEDLNGLAPTFIGAAALDYLVDENIEYARRLLAAGVATELVVAPGCFHGFDGISQTKVAQRFRHNLTAALSQAFEAVRHSTEKC